jgi:hypothetical protein
MSEKQSPEELAKQQHESNKVVREHLAWVHYRLQSIPMIFEEHKLLHGALNILQAICLDLQTKIELVEPPPKKEEAQSKPALVIDAPALQAIENH